MFLESIEIFGFKTFVTNTRILLSPGITCIVGPNGAGKSNIVDAVRWVLGEQRYTLLRATESTDLIFSGSGLRKPMSVASVKLILNNEAHTLPLKTPRVIIERRFYRTKESHYYLNGEEASLQKINSVFHAANVFGYTNSIVGQGKIEEILLSRPEEKKSLIDRIAGIDVYKRKKEEAEKKLTEVGDNLTRVSDRLKALKENTEKIVNDAKKAHMYYILKDRLAEEETVLINYELKELKNSAEIIKKGLEELQIEIDEINASILEKKKDHDALNALITDLEKKKEEMGECREKLLVSNAELSSKENYLREKLEETEKKMKDNNIKMENLERARSAMIMEVEELESKRNALHERLSEEKNKIQEIQENILNLRKIVEPYEREEEERRKKIEEISEERIHSEKILSAKQTELSFLRKQESDLQNKIKEINSEKPFDKELLADRLTSLNREKEALYHRLEEVSENITLIKFKSSEMKKSISPYQNMGAPFSEKSLGSILHIEKEFPGIEEELNTSILPSIEELKKQREGKFFINSNIQNFKEYRGENVISIQEFMGIHSDFLYGIYYAVDLPSAIKFFKEYAEKLFIKKIITGDGFIVLSPFEVEISLNITTKNRIEEIKEMEKNLEKALKDRDSISKEIDEKEHLIKDIEAEIIQAEEHQKRLENLAFLKEELQHTQENIKTGESELITLKERISTSISSLGLLTENGEFKEKQKEIERLKELLVKSNSNLMEHEFDNKKITESILDKKKKIESINYDTENTKKETDILEKEEQVLKNNLNLTIDSLNKLSLDIKEVGKKESELRADLKKLTDKEKSVSIEISKLEEQKQDISRKMEKSRILIAQREAEIQGITNRLKEEEIPERDIPYKVDVDASKKNISELKKEIEELGAINFTSIEEEENALRELEEKERVYNDVKSSKKELEKFIDEMDNRIKNEFEITLKGIEKNFQSFYERMFKGGKASLEKIPDELGEVRGIELNVTLPGKKKQSLHLLSGGEKTLVALAFLFAIFKVKPSPFYILDEVDAALDEDNVVKFGEILEEEAEDAQFIVITHNKETMQRGDFLYGITMEEEGVSKVVSLKLV